MYKFFWKDIFIAPLINILILPRAPPDPVWAQIISSLDLLWILVLINLPWYSFQGTSGTRLEAQVEVGGWPLPDIFWFKDDEPLETKMHTENYNGYFNAYVPERKVEVSIIVVCG